MRVSGATHLEREATHLKGLSTIFMIIISLSVFVFFLFPLLVFAFCFCILFMVNVLKRFSRLRIF